MSERDVTGRAEIRKVIRISKVGNIAGCFVLSGVVQRDSVMRLARDGKTLWQGPIDVMRRFKEEVHEVRKNFECGLTLRGFDGFREGDILEVVTP